MRDELLSVLLIGRPARLRGVIVAGECQIYAGRQLVATIKTIEDAVRLVAQRPNRGEDSIATYRVDVSVLTSLLAIIDSARPAR